MERDRDPLIDLNADEDGTRAAFRRRRALTIGLTGVAALAVIVSGGLMVQSMRSTGAVPTDTAAALSPTPEPTDTVEAGLGRTTPTPTVGATATTPPRTQTVPAPTAGDDGLPAGPDLRVSGPTSVTLQSDGTVYRGQFSVAITNAGAPYSITSVYLILPTGVQIDFPGTTGFAQCLTTAPPYTWICSGNTIPAGGSVTHTVHLRADYAPLSTPMTLTGFVIRYSAPGEIAPSDDGLAITIELPAAA